MRKNFTCSTGWFRSGLWVAGFSAVVGWVVVSVALDSPLLGGEEPLTLKGHNGLVWNVTPTAD